MDYEQKYKEALERARELKNKLEKSCSFETARGIESIFPELAESEDESIRKSLIEHLQYEVDDMAKRDCVLDFEAEIEELSKYIAWLKKQVEKSDYNPYKATIESIATMVEKYANGDLKDFYDNIKVKCKDAMEYDTTWNKKNVYNFRGDKKL